MLFADDTNIIYSHNNVDTLTATLNNELVNVALWFKSNNLSLNIDKTSFIYFRNNHSHNAQCNIFFVDGILLTKKNRQSF